MRELRQSTAFTHKAGPFIDVDGAPVPGLDIDQADVRLSKNGGAFAQKNDATANAAHDENGYYLITCNATDSGTLGHLRLSIVESGAIIAKEDFMVLSAYEWDRKYAANMQALGGIVGFGTAQSASSTGVVLAAADAYADDTLIGMTLLAFGSTQGYWQSRIITDNALSGDTVTVDTWTVTPTGTITYVIVGTPPGSVSSPAPVNTVQFAGQTITAAAGVTLPSSVASPTNITAGTITTATNLTNLPTIPANWITAAGIAADAIGASELAADAATEIVTAIFARADTAAFGSLTFAQTLHVLLAVLAGKSSGLDTGTIKYRNLNDSADVVAATGDASGNRSAITLTP